MEDLEKETFSEDLVDLEKEAASKDLEKVAELEDQEKEE